jgi:hypothetical protein
MATHTYRFSEFQAGLVESGKKSLTIRAPRRRRRVRTAVAYDDDDVSDRKAATA